MAQGSLPRLTRRQFLQGALWTASLAIAQTFVPSPVTAQKPIAVGDIIVDDAPGVAPTDRVLRPLRSPHRQPFWHSATSSLPPLGVIAMNRMAYGPRPGDLDAFAALGSTDDARLDAYVEQQLDPQSIDDSALEARLVGAGFVTLDLSLERLWSEYFRKQMGERNGSMPMIETERAAFLRAIYSERQLVEVLADFWHNHFNVDGWTYLISSVFVHHDREVIRGHMLGNYREMLEAVTTSTAMLYYLDNYTNSRAGPNENWARELLELHTLGAEHYRGVARQSEVPRDAEGLPVGYVDDDVYEATRCFTGWTFGEDGLFAYRDDWHDRFQKTVLGKYLPADQDALRDGRDVLDLVADHPGTAVYVCRKLCRRLISDTPPEAVVQSAAEVFRQQRQAADQLAQVVGHILRSEAFRTTWGEKIKRPFEAIVSAMRATGAEWTLSLDEEKSSNFIWLYDQIGQPLYNWLTPDGYPDTKEDWLGTTSLVMRWRMVNWLLEVKDGEVFRTDVLSQTPAEVRSPVALADFWINRLLGHAMSTEGWEEVVDFMAQGRNPEFDLPLDGDTAVQERLRSMVGLILMSPEFQLR